MASFVPDYLPSNPKPPEACQSNNWMNHLKENITLKDILLFGTHDSGAWIGKGMNMDIKDQLVNGVRFLDLHLATFEKATWVYHDRACTTLLQATIEIETFIREFGKNEKIFLRLRESKNAPMPVIWESVKKLLEKGTHNTLVSIVQATMPICKMKGSIILLAPKELDIPGNWEQDSIAHYETPELVIEEKDLRAFLSEEAFKKELRPVWVECRSRLDEQLRQGIEVKAVDNYLVKNFGKSSFNIVTFSFVDSEVFSILKPFMLP